MRRASPQPVEFHLVQDAFPILTLVGFALLLWLLLIRPQQRRQRELARMQSSLEVGDEVMLTSGIFGTVVALDEIEAQVEIAAGTTIRVVRGAVGQVAAGPTTGGTTGETRTDDDVSEES